MVYPDKKCVEISIPKTGTVSRYAMISDEFSIDDPDIRDKVAKSSNTGRMLSDNLWPLTPAAKYSYSIHGHFTFKQWKEQQAYKTENYFSFSFVRNPYDRLISIMYNDGFQSVSEFIHNNNYANTIKRYGTQFEFLEDKNGEIGVDFVGKLENYEEDYNKLREFVPLLPPFNAKYQLNKTKTKPKIPFEQYYNAKTKDFVYELLKDDFIKLGYEK